MRIGYTINNFNGNFLQATCCKRQFYEDILTLARILLSKKQQVAASIHHLFHKIKWYVIGILKLIDILKEFFQVGAWYNIAALRLAKSIRKKIEG